MCSLVFITYRIIMYNLNSLINQQMIYKIKFFYTIRIMVCPAKSVVCEVISIKFYVYFEFLFVFSTHLFINVIYLKYVMNVMLIWLKGYLNIHLTMMFGLKV